MNDTNQILKIIGAIFAGLIVLGVIGNFLPDEEPATVPVTEQAQTADQANGQPQDGAVQDTSNSANATAPVNSQAAEADNGAQATSAPTGNTQTKTVQPTASATTSSSKALGRLLNENAALSPSQIVSLYNSLNQQDRNWLDIETKFTQFLQLIACQEHLDFVTYDYTGTAYTCATVAQSYQEALQYITQEQLVQNADTSRLSILNGYNCQIGVTDRSLCQQYFDTQSNFQAGDRATFDSINNNIGGYCEIGSDPNCR